VLLPMLPLLSPGEDLFCIIDLSRAGDNNNNKA
jgi:hypothetical protein